MLFFFNYRGWPHEKRLRGLLLERLDRPRGLAGIVMLFALAVIPVALLLWLAFKRPGLRIVGNMDTVHSSAAQNLFESPGLKVDGIYLTEIIELGDDLLVGYRHGPDTALSDQTSKDSPGGGRPASHEEGQMLLPRMVRDQQGMLLVQRWYADRTALASLTSADRTLFGLLDRRRGMALVVELSVPN